MGGERRSVGRKRSGNERLAAVYAPQVLAAMPRLLGQLDREPDSVSVGVFDRDYWAWKFRDFPLGMLQLGAYPLALLWRYPLPGSPYFQNPRVLQWVFSMVERTLASQHRNGAFSSFVPNEQDPMSTLAMVYGLGEVCEAVGDDMPEALGDRLQDGLRRGSDFCLTRDEGHAFVNNHWALCAVAYRHAFEVLGDAHYQARADEIIDRILAEQSPDGCYNEYGGPDPGYETLGIFYLARYWLKTGSQRVLDSLKRSVAFHAHGVHPDGSVGGVYGSRHTSLYMPAGFEILAGEIPMAAATARFMRERLGRANVVTLATVDTENIVPLTYGYLEACFAPGGEPPDLPPLPCETSDLRRCFEDVGLVVASTDSYYAVLNGRKGGVCRVFDKSRETIAYEDAGYVLRARGRAWTSQLMGLGSTETGEDSDEIVATTRFAELRQELATPVRFLVLRLLNLTLFRHPGLGNWIRKQIAVRLILSQRPAPYRLRRRVRFESDRVEFEDRIVVPDNTRVDDVSLPRSLTAIHMGSAKYFHPSELEPIAEPTLAGLREALNREGVATHAFAVSFEGGEGARPRPVASSSKGHGTSATPH